MSEKMKYIGFVSEGNFVLYENDRLAFKTFLQKYKEGEEMQMTISKKRKLRTSGKPWEDTNFNGYLWGIAYKIIGDEIGEIDLDYIHHWAQMKTGHVKGMPDGSVVPRGTSDLSGGEFSEYCSRVRTWAGTPGNIVERGIYIPEPNETF